MRSVIFLGIISLSLCAQSSSVGDKAVSYGEMELGGAMIPIGFTQEIVAQNLDAQTATVRTTYDIFGEPSTRDDEKPLSQILSQEDGAKIVRDCVVLKGVPETIEVPAGVFDTCKLPVVNDEGTGFVWYGPVSFAEVMSEIKKHDSSDKSTWYLMEWK